MFDSKDINGNIAPVHFAIETLMQTVDSVCFPNFPTVNTSHGDNVNIDSFINIMQTIINVFKQRIQKLVCTI